MNLTYLAIVFLIIIIILRFKAPLSGAITGGIVATIVLFKIPPISSAEILLKSALSWPTLSVVLMCYLITLLQRMLEKRGHLDLARHSLDGLFNSRRINASIAPLFIGLLPSPSAIFISGAMVDATCEDYLTKEEKTFVTSFFRHIPESFLPTYAAIIIALSIVPTISAGKFMLSMFPVVFAAMFLGYFFYLRKLPKNPPRDIKEPKLIHIKGLVKSLWTIAAIIVLIIGFDISIYVSSGVIILIALVIYKFTFKELAEVIKSAFEGKIILNTFVIMMLKDILAHTGAIQELPDVLSRLPIPSVIIFAILFFISGLISGSNATMAMCMPLAVAAFPNMGLPMFMLYMSMLYASMQVSPTHICLSMAAEYFGVSLGNLIKRNIQIISMFIPIVCVYYLILTSVL